ncbi:TlpA family protein disulfide reductase [Nocardioides mesophilus]|uniref:TlpA family protein disulfide reductase n=1 Tax=Nocardioides mesophilus TaxID=433659 RepID=A0A7G9RGC7_9ACTN|nr:TlpA disulfide reductase family protein [Nocardioides mesophilus]QNN54652.1 TlpA family protein disulfide reductase [Nocardioides mesophilus]
MTASLRLAAAVAAAVLAAGCAAAGTGTGTGAGSGSEQVEVPHSNVDVDTAALRKQKAAAGIEDCPAITHTTGAMRAAGSGESLPQITLPCLGGGPAVALDRLRGPLVINLFAQWCGPCRQELPYYEQLHRRAGDRLDVLGIDYLDTQPGGALELAKDSGVTYPLLADPEGLLRTELRVRGLPGIVFVDADGRVTETTFAVVRSYDELAGLVEEHLDVTL